MALNLQATTPTPKEILQELKDHHPYAYRRLSQTWFEEQRLDAEVTYIADSLELIGGPYPFVKSWARLDDQTQLLLAYADDTYYFLLMPVRGLYVGLY